jgi:L-lactate dehydrogenase (cytochrome)
MDLTPLRYITCIEDMRATYRRKVPKAFMEYCEAGSYSQSTLAANRDDMEKVKLRQRVLVDMSARDHSTTILGEKVAIPLVLAPVGSCGMQRGDGEILAARAANAAGIPFTLSTMSICSIEDVAEATGKPFWFQLYVMRDREFIRDLIARAGAAKCGTLVLTVDLQVLGQRHCDIKNGLSVPPEVRLSNVLDIATKPGWVMSILKGKRRSFGNLDGHLKGIAGVRALGQWTSSQFDQALNWKDVEWIKSLWPGKLVIKGILDLEDARLAVKSGADAIVVSNHGGRQLDGAPSSIAMLPRVADAVGSDIEVLFDGGVRTGMDLMRALALGAKGCMIGRAYIYGLGAYGEMGVAKSIDIIKRELDTTMALCGVTRISDIDERVIASVPQWPSNTMAIGRMIEN